MSSHFHDSIAALQEALKPLEEQVNRKKWVINALCIEAGIPQIYADLENSDTRTTSPATQKHDEFFSKPLNTSIKTLLANRKAADQGPATAEQILDGLLAGGYEKFPSDRNDALNNLRISLGKSSHTFVKLPNGMFGMSEWYGIKKPKAAMAGEESRAADSGTESASSPVGKDAGEAEVA